MDIPIKIKLAQISCEMLSTYNITTQFFKISIGFEGVVEAVTYQNLWDRS